MNQKCTTSEREFLDWLYKEHTELRDGDLLGDFSGWYADWNEIINAMPEDVKLDGYSQCPTEMIHRLANQRDEITPLATELCAACDALPANDGRILGLLPLIGRLRKAMTF